jgi:predicted RNA binding protein YcfA (HicA-like mRNA interferase family)
LAKLRVLSGREVCAILVQHGFTEVRRRGSHIVMQKKLPQGTVTVPVPDHGEIHTGTLQSIIR